VIDRTAEAVAERRGQVAMLTRQGFTAPDIAQRLGITVRSVQRHRLAAGVRQPRVPLLSAAEKQQAQELLSDGASCAEVARTLGRSHTAILRIFPEYRFDKGRAAEAAALGRALARLERAG
jgi:DNA-binding CsgD family transcriptional regulator